MVGRNFGRAPPSLRRKRPSAIPNDQPRRNATYHSRETVQTTGASSQHADIDHLATQGEERYLRHQRADGAAGGPYLGDADQGAVGDSGARPVAPRRRRVRLDRQATTAHRVDRPQIIQDSVDASRVAEQLRTKMRGGRVDAVNWPAALQVGAKDKP